MSPTKICHLTSVHTPFDNRIFEKQCKTIRDAGYEMVLVAVHDQDEVVDGVRIRAVPRASGRLRRIIQTAYRVYRAALDEDAALYQIHDPELLPFAQLLRLRGKRVIFDMHENLPGSIKTKAWLPAAVRKPLAWAFRAIEPLLMAGLPVIFAEESYHKDYQWVRNYTFVLNMPDLGILLGIQADAPYERPTVGYIGRVAQVRGADVTLDALHLLQQEGCQVDYECVGAATDHYMALFEDKVARYGLQGVHFRGFMRAHEGWGSSPAARSGWS